MLNRICINTCADIELPDIVMLTLKIQTPLLLIIPVLKFEVAGSACLKCTYEMANNVDSDQTAP